jgi:hypothetical protein
MDLVNESVTFLMVSLKDGFVWNDIMQGFFYCDLVSSQVFKDCFQVQLVMLSFYNFLHYWKFQ